MKYFLSAGEASGDLHASRLIRSLREQDPEADFRFLGGDLMAREAGRNPEIHYRRMAFMGFSEVIRHLPLIFSNMTKAKKALTNPRPDVLILVDYPDFNLQLALEARKAGIPVVYYISPKVWAWKSWRTKDMSRLLDMTLCILPFEPPFLKSRGVENAIYVGNPSVEEVDSALANLQTRERFVAEHDITSRPILALVPGSRRGEIRNNLPIMADAAQAHPELQAVIAAAPGIDIEYYRRFTTLTLIENDTLSLMAHAEAALVTSGTATLECALTGTPQVVCYRGNGSALTYAIMRRLLKIDYVSLPNLIAGKEIVPERLLNRCTPQSVEKALNEILPGGSRRSAVINGYADMRRALGESHAADLAAKHILELLKRKN